MTAEVQSDGALKTEEVAVQAVEEKKSSTDDVVVVVAERDDAVLEKSEEEPAPALAEEVKKNDAEASPTPAVQKSSSFKEESYLGSDLKEHEKKALNELKQKVGEAILNNQIFKKDKPVEEEKPAQEEQKVNDDQNKDKSESVDQEATEPETEEKAVKVNDDQNKDKSESVDQEAKEPETEEKAVEVVDKEEEKIKPIEEEENVDKEISLWGVPLLASKGSESTDVVLLKFLRAREFKVNEAFEMLKNTLQWRKENKIESILEENLGADLSSVAYMDGLDREGHPICYNIYGVFENEELYQKTFGTEEKRDEFLRWRFQLMENGINKLDFKPGGVSSLLQINDLKNSPGPSKKELRVATKKAVGLLQDNYPEFVARNIFINVPFWYYAFNALLSPFLTQRTKSKFLFARPAKVTETLLKYIPAEQVPVHYGGLKRENDAEFSVEDGPVLELFVKSGSKECIEIPAPEVGTTLVWDLTVLGWEVSYKEEFVPTDEGSYTIIVQKEKKMGSNEESIRNSFKNNEPGKIVLTIDNSSFKKKRVIYRHKTKNSSS